MFRMIRRREPVPFAFVAEADRFRSNITPPPRPRARPSEIAGRVLMGLTIVAAFVGAVIIGTPAMQSGGPQHSTTHQAQQSPAPSGH
jgi:hypothetical protein